MEPRKGKVQLYQGKVSPCVVCGVTPNVGDDIWMQNIGDDNNKNWLISPHEECFKKIQVDPTLMKKSKSGFPPKPRRTPEERLADSKAMLDKIWDIAVAKAMTVYPDPQPTNSADQAHLAESWKEISRNRSILSQVFIKVMAMEYSR